MTEVREAGPYSYQLVDDHGNVIATARRQFKTALNQDAGWEIRGDGWSTQLPSKRVALRVLQDAAKIDRKFRGAGR